MSELGWKPVVHGRLLASKMLAGALRRQGSVGAKRIAEKLEDYVDAEIESAIA